MQMLLSKLAKHNWKCSEHLQKHWEAWRGNLTGARWNDNTQQIDGANPLEPVQAAESNPPLDAPQRPSLDWVRKVPGVHKFQPKGGRRLHAKSLRHQEAKCGICC